MAAILELDEHLNKSFKVSIPSWISLWPAFRLSLVHLADLSQCAVDIKVFARVMWKRHIRLSDKVFMSEPYSLQANAVELADSRRCLQVFEAAPQDVRGVPAKKAAPDYFL